MNNKVRITVYCKREKKKRAVEACLTNFKHIMVKKNIDNMEYAKIILDTFKIQIENTGNKFSLYTPYKIYDIIKTDYEPYFLNSYTLEHFNPNLDYVTLDGEEYKVNKISYNLPSDSGSYSIHIEKIIKCPDDEIEELDPEIGTLYDVYSEYLDSLENEIDYENNRATGWWNLINAKYQELKWFNFIKKRKLLDEFYGFFVGLDLYKASIDKEAFKNKSYRAIKFIKYDSLQSELERSISK